MNKRYGVNETSVQLRKVDKHGNDEMQDCVAGINIIEGKMLQLDLRNLRPVRVLDRDSLLVEVYLHDILTA